MNDRHNCASFQDVFIERWRTHMSFTDQTIGEFLDSVASTTVTPSGGAVAAVGGAAGAALCEMVCIHTIGKDGYAEVEREMTDVRNELGANRIRLLELADEDSAAVDELQEAFRTPSSDERDEAIGEAAKRAIEVPVETAEECLDVIEHAAVITEKGNRNAIADAATGALLAHATLQSSVMTARLNLEMIENATFVAEIEHRSTEIDDSAARAVKQVRENISDVS